MQSENIIRLQGHEKGLPFPLVEQPHIGLPIALQEAGTRSYATDDGDAELGTLICLHDQVTLSKR